MRWGLFPGWILVGLGFYASALRIVASGIMVLSCSCVRPSVHPETLLTHYLADYLTHFHLNKVNDAL